MKNALGQPPVVLSFGGSNFFERDGTINSDYVKEACRMLISVKEQGVPLCVVVGGGHTAKTYADAIRKISGNEFYADRLGIRACRLNALLLISVLDRHAYPHVIDNMDQAFNALRSNLIPVAGGMMEGLTTDTISVLLGERLEATLGEFREGVVMTRYFSQVVLEDAGGTLIEVEELAVPEEA